MLTFWRLALCATVLIVASSLLPLFAGTDVMDELTQYYQSQEGRYDFEQTKQLQGLPRPFVSSGYLQLGENELEWITKLPVHNEIRVTQQGVYEKQNQQTQRIAGSEVVAGLLLALLNQNHEYLLQYFQFRRTDSKCMSLIPLAEPLSGLYSQLVVCGENTIESIQLIERSGNTTDIRLTFRGH